MPHGRHIYAKASDIAQATMCAYPRYDHALPDWKCVLRCCDDCPCINITYQETDNQNSDTTPSIMFHIYHIIARCTAHGRIPLKYNKTCYMCKQESSSDESRKIYTRKETVITETTISDFNTSLYIPAIQKLAFHLPHVRILGTNHCGEMRRTDFKRRELFQYFLCRCDYDERVVAIFAHQIQSEYYGVNISVSIEGILLEPFSTLPQPNINSTTPSNQRHSVFYSFLSDDSKQYAATTTAHSKHLISFLK